MISATQQQKNTTRTGLLLTILLLVICLVPLHYFFQDIPAATRFLISRCLFWLSLGVIYLYALKEEKQTLLLWPENKQGIVFYLVSVVALIGCIFIGAPLIALIVHFAGGNMQSKAVQTILGFSLPLRLLAVVTAAVVEEFIFRGYLMPRLQLLFRNNYVPVIISTLIFGLAHMGFGTVMNMAIPSFIGLLFALHYQKYRNIKVLILCHFLIDFYSVIAVR